MLTPEESEEFVEKSHYVYQLVDKETEEFYFGVRSCEGDPQDDTYMGSYTVWSPEDPDRLTKIVLCEFDTREKASECERKIIKRHIKHKNNRNYHITPNKFCTYGISHSEETKHKISIANSGENHWNYGNKIPEETKKKMRGKRGKREEGYKSYIAIHGHSEETKEKLSKIAKERVKDPAYMEKIIRRGKDHHQYGKRGEKAHASKPVLHIQSGHIFPSCTETAKHFDITRSAIGRHCRGDVDNQKFKYVTRCF